jgi:3-isopropylmalate/(R)-2-methylmalate dehydratase small subunit
MSFASLTSIVTPLLLDNVDTDQLIPARFLKVTSSQGLGASLFCDIRSLASGEPDPACVLNQPRYQGSAVLLAGENFGCGSSREHAPWALKDAGFRVILATSFGDIFKNNCYKNGLLPLTISPQTHASLAQQATQDAPLQVTINLPAQTLIVGELSIPFEIDSFWKHCLEHNVDQIDYVLSFRDKIEAYEAANPRFALA